jgi:cytochrome c peroxidase
MKYIASLFALGFLGLSGALGFQNDALKLQGLTQSAIRQKFAPLDEAFISPKNPITDQRITLGRMLFYDKRLSKNQDMSCNTCHPLNQYGVDHQPVSIGFVGTQGRRNAPTVYNAGGQFAQFWDGRAPDLEQQAKGPILNPLEMAMPSKAAVVARLESIPGYVEAFQLAFPGDRKPVTYENMARAIGAFERQLITPSRWDEYLKGNQSALTSEEKAGLEKFITYDCSGCHDGLLLGGQKYEKLGFWQPWPDQSDRGRSEITKRRSHDMTFKVPSLRNVAETAPYFHNGSAAKLETAVFLMGKHQLGIHLTDSDISLIVAFLKSLTGKIPDDYVREPTLPE